MVHLTTRGERNTIAHFDPRLSPAVLSPIRLLWIFCPSPPFRPLCNWRAVRNRAASSAKRRNIFLAVLLIRIDGFATIRARRGAAGMAQGELRRRERSDKADAASRAGELERGGCLLLGSTPIQKPTA